ncbi:MAG: hypothetical protein WCF90_10435 [Methanomicrobiales archaeon]
MSPILPSGVTTALDSPHIPYQGLAVRRNHGNGKSPFLESNDPVKLEPAG